MQAGIRSSQRSARRAEQMPEIRASRPAHAPRRRMFAMSRACPVAAIRHTTASQVKMLRLRKLRALPPGGCRQAPTHAHAARLGRIVESRACLGHRSPAATGPAGERTGNACGPRGPDPQRRRAQVFIKCRIFHHRCQSNRPKRNFRTCLFRDKRSQRMEFPARVMYRGHAKLACARETSNPSDEAHHDIP